MKIIGIEHHGTIFIIKTDGTPKEIPIEHRMYQNMLIESFHEEKNLIGKEITFDRHSKTIYFKDKVK